MPTPVQYWRARDGKDFPYEGAALAHESELDKCAAADFEIATGGSLWEALKTIGESGNHEEHSELLSTVTKATGFSVSHWQCREEPGYSLGRRGTDGRWYLGGDAGSWSGGFGEFVTVGDLIRYALNTVEKYGKMPPRWERKEST